MILQLVFPTELTSASLQVRWCLDAELLQTVRLTQKTAYVCISVRYSNRARDVHIYPLSQLQAYVPIRKAGEFTMQATIAYSDAENKRDIEKCFVIKSVDRQFLESDTEYCPDRLSLKGTVKTLSSSELYDLEIGPEAFGKPIPKWLSPYINKYWYRDSPIDDCDRRQRMLRFPFTTLPILTVHFLLSELITVLEILVVLLFGAWTKSPGSLRHPLLVGPPTGASRTLIYVPSAVYDYCKRFLPSFVSKELLLFYTAPIIPLPLLAVGAILYIQYSIVSLTTLLLVNYIILHALLFFVAAVFAISLAILFFGKLIKSGSKRMQSYFAHRMPRLSAAFGSQVRRLIDYIDSLLNQSSSTILHTQEQDRETALLLCEQNNGECLPEIMLKDKTIRLIYADFKNKVCKPLQS